MFLILWPTTRIFNYVCGVGDNKGTMNSSLVRSLPVFMTNDVIESRSGKMFSLMTRDTHAHGVRRHALIRNENSNISGLGKLAMSTS